MTLAQDMEALQTQAKGPTTPTLARPPKSTYTTVADGAHGTLAGYPTGPGEKTESRTWTRVYVDAPSGSGNSVTPTAGAVAATDIWEEVYQSHATVPTFILRAARGTTFTLADFGRASLDDF